MRRWLAIVLASGLSCANAQSTGASLDITLHGTAANRAVISIGGGAPRTVSVGQSVDGVKLISTEADRAVIEIDGKRRRIEFGANAIVAGNASPSPTPTSSDEGNAQGSGRAVLQSDGRGHFLAQGQINGVGVSMMVDTGATLVVLPASEARRLGIDYQRNGMRGMASTANGVIPVWRVKLDSVRVQGIVLYGVEASVQEAPLAVILLGNAFLSRLQMQRDGERMLLVQRY
ncbi:MAG TPA: TIGR02281 family clan AA aspartic protease [Burkholderiaceae bacterium]|nr:TIGR02281 family clan AA aspartic protease [Burkholderiaceae bacterium]